MSVLISWTFIPKNPAQMGTHGSIREKLNMWTKISNSGNICMQIITMQCLSEIHQIWIKYSTQYSTQTRIFIQHCKYSEEDIWLWLGWPPGLQMILRGEIVFAIYKKLYFGFGKKLCLGFSRSCICEIVSSLHGKVMSRFRLTRRPVGSFDLQFTDFVILAHIIIFQYIIYVSRSFFVIIFISIKKISKSFNEQAQCVCVWTLLNHRIHLIAYNLG